MSERTTTFRSFHAAFPPDTKRAKYDAARFDALAAKVPPGVAAEWRTFGFGGYGNGLLWTPRPDEGFFDPDDWPGLEDSAIEVVRTAFADVCVWQGGRFHWLSVYSGKMQALSTKPEIMFDGLTGKDFRKSVLRERLFAIAREKHGDLGPNECYGFSPLPALGGAIAEEYLIKTEMRPYVAVAAQAGH